jgi:hypothetical protein
LDDLPLVRWFIESILLSDAQAGFGCGAWEGRYLATTRRRRGRRGSFDGINKILRIGEGICYSILQPDVGAWLILRQAQDDRILKRM